ncbi:adenylyl-sulfate kinase [Robbsia andropogonis]|uniref:adenylyl-sulfate kinase n=1 Tax=Robbsia andropogonis TaxID=28092 RepID=UPI0009E02C7C|nr:adenylyl-sulfate kinase [Robbsia andropogonis]
MGSPSPSRAFDHGVMAIAALISPYRADRTTARHVIGEERFVETFMSTSLTVCEARDPKGLYRKARAGEITNLTGIGDLYEVPLAPDLTFDSSVLSIEESVNLALELIGASNRVVASSR